jgi:hypothetical protein
MSNSQWKGLRQLCEQYACDSVRACVSVDVNGWQFIVLQRNVHHTRVALQCLECVRAWYAYGRGGHLIGGARIDVTLSGGDMHMLSTSRSCARGSVRLECGGRVGEVSSCALIDCEREKQTQNERSNRRGVKAVEAANGGTLVRQIPSPTHLSTPTIQLTL